MKYPSSTASGLTVLGTVLLTLIALMIGGCSESFLEPSPKSFLSPENVLTDKRGIEGLTDDLNRSLRTEYYGGHHALLTEYYFTDLAICAGPGREPVWPHDLITQLTPTANLSFVINTGTYWNNAYRAISTANQVISNIDNVTNWSGEIERDARLAVGYFHRSYWYYRLVHQFGDVPVYLNAIEQPRVDFRTYEREAILMKIRDDMEFAVEHLPRHARPGQINRGAGYYLLTKIYLSLRQFQDAVEAASQVLDGSQYALMTDRFGQGPYADNSRFDVLWDLHQKENKSLAENTEGILVVQDKRGVTGNAPGGTNITRYATPLWWWTTVRDPNGVTAVTDGPEGNPLSDSLGRGIGALRTVPYFNYEIWNDEDDLRHSEVNWFSLDDFYYNSPSSEYYGEAYVREYVQDTTVTWYPFMYNKLYVRDEIRTHRKAGGHSDWYIYRVAGLHLLRAEAYFWQGNLSQAADDINAVRERAEAEPVSTGEVTLDYIFDERARELYYEEPRKTELTRVAYIMAQLGRDGYSLSGMSQNNWYYDRVMESNVYYRDQIHYGANPYRIDAYHVYWPIPQDEIDSNVDARINQAPGYTGASDNVEPLGYEALQQLAENRSDGS